MPQAVISGTGLYQPPHIVTNEELVTAYNAYAEQQNALNADVIARGEAVAMVPSSVEFIEKASGIKQRYVVVKDGVLDPTRMRPKFQERGDDELSLMAEIAVEIQQALGAGGYGFDMNVACSSATFAIEQAVNAVRSGSVKCALVVNPEITSAHIEWKDRDCHFIFGDVCTATVIESADTATSPDQWEIVGTRLATQFSNAIRNNFGFINRSEDSDPLARDKTFRQEGRKVFKEVVPMAAAHIEAHLKSQGLEPTQMRRFWLHQANLGMNQLILKKLVGAEAGSEMAPLVLDTYANTSSAGSIIAFHEYHADLKPGDLGVICSFGAGYSIGSVIVRRK